MVTRPTPRPSAAPASSPRPQMRDPVKAQQFVDSQSGGNDSPAAAAAVASSPAVQRGIASIFGGGGGSQDAGGGFNPFNFGVIGIARALLGAMSDGNEGPTRADRPMQRPSVMQRDNELVATRDMPRFGFEAGDTAAVPDFSPFSFRSFTSTDPGNVMRNIMGAERNMAAMPVGGNDDPPILPAASPVDTSAMPASRPAWWPSYLPWPPESGAGYNPAPPVMGQYNMPDPSLAPFQPYSTSYSGLQGAISGSTNPLMLGIGGMVRRR